MMTVLSPVAIYVVCYQVLSSVVAKKVTSVGLVFRGRTIQCFLFEVGCCLIAFAV